MIQSAVPSGSMEEACEHPQESAEVAAVDVIQSIVPSGSMEEAREHPQESAEVATVDVIQSAEQ